MECFRAIFKTAGNPLETNFRFLAGGDVQHDMDLWGTITNTIASEFDDVDFILQTGDLADNSYRKYQWDSIFLKGKNYFQKFLEYRVIGNHDLDGADIFLSQFTMPNNKKWYSFEFGDVLFISLLSNIEYYNSEDEEA